MTLSWRAVEQWSRLLSEVAVAHDATMLVVPAREYDTYRMRSPHRLAREREYEGGGVQIAPLGLSNMRMEWSEANVNVAIRRWYADWPQRLDREVALSTNFMLVAEHRPRIFTLSAFDGVPNCSRTSLDRLRAHFVLLRSSESKNENTVNFHAYPRRGGAGVVPSTLVDPQWSLGYLRISCNQHPDFEEL